MAINVNVELDINTLCYAVGDADGSEVQEFFTDVVLAITERYRYHEDMEQLVDNLTANITEYNEDERKFINMLNKALVAKYGEPEE